MLKNRNQVNSIVTTAVFFWVMIFISSASRTEIADRLSTWVELEMPNFLAISTVVGEATVFAESTSKGLLSIAGELGYFPQAAENDVVKREVTTTVKFWYNLSTERYRWDLVVNSEEFVLLRSWEEVDRVSRSPAALQSYAEGQLCENNYCVRFNPSQNHSVRDPDNNSKILIVRKALREEGPSSTALLEKDSRNTAISLPYLFSGGYHRTVDYRGISYTVKQIRDWVTGKTQLPDLPVPVSLPYRLDQTRFEEKQEEDGFTRYTHKILPDDGTEFVRREWLVDHKVPACVWMWADASKSEVYIEHKWEWQNFDGISFPVFAKFRNYKVINEKEVNSWSQEFSLSNIRVNQPIDEQKFTIADLGLQEGDYMYDITNDITYPVEGL